MAERAGRGDSRNPLLNAVVNATPGEAASAANPAPVAHGIAEIDDQHLVILTLADRLLAAVTAALPPQQLRQQLDGLREAVQSHFVSEETLMRLVLYPELPEHRALHARLLDDLNAVALSGDQAASEDLAALQQFGARFAEHFREADGRYVAYLRTRGESDQAHRGLFEKL